MNKEAYVSFEIAELLWQKNFNWECITYYDKYNKSEIVYMPSGFTQDAFVGFSAPTQQMACRWLREIKNIDIEPFVYSHHHDGSKEYGCNIQQNGHLLMTESFVHIRYEDAVEAALKFVLKNLV